MENENLPSISHERIASFEKEIGDKRKANKSNFIFRTVFFFIILFSICLLPFLPPFSCKNMTLDGNYLLTKQDVLDFGGYKENTPLILVDDKKIEQELLKQDYILEAKVKWSFVGLDVDVDELACLLHIEENGEFKYLLSDGSYLSDFKAKNPSSTHDFKEANTPRLISDISFDNIDNDSNIALERRLRLFKNLKEISPNVLKDVTYFDVVYGKDNITLLFGFYFNVEGDYYRVLMRDEAFAFFLEERRIDQIINAIKNTSNKIVYNHDTINSLSYTNTICGYDGTQNVCRVNVSNGEEEIL